MKLGPWGLGLLSIACHGLAQSGGDGGASATSSSSGVAGGSGAVTGGAGGTAGGSGTGGASVRACADTIRPLRLAGCRSQADCVQGTGWVKCCGNDDPCWAGSCPLPPSLCPGTGLTCASDGDCNLEGGKCVRMRAGCPECETSHCEYPPPKCSPDPDDCGDAARCQPDGTCTPRRCDDGYACGSELRCRVGSVRADEHGCELIPCDDGWTCEENWRCLAPFAKDSHGCERMRCSADSDCDCGFCVEGTCGSDLGVCTPQPS